MASPTVTDCENYLREEIKRVDTSVPLEKRNNPQFYKHNILFYSWLVQRKEVSITWERLASLVGAPTVNELKNLTDLFQFYEAQTDLAVRLIPAMETAVEKVFNDPKLYYHISQPVPFFGDLKGDKLVEYLNRLGEPDGIATIGLFRNAMGDALQGAQAQMPDSDFPYIRLMSGPNDIWHVLLAVFPHYGVLYEDQVLQLTSDIGLVREKLFDEGYSNLHTLVMTSGIDERAKKRIGKSRHLHHLWSLSTLRFFHLFENSIKKYDKHRELMAEKFPVIFETEAPSITFSVRDAMARLEKAVEEAIAQKKLNTSTRRSPRRTPRGGR